MTGKIIIILDVSIDPFPYAYVPACEAIIPNRFTDGRRQVHLIIMRGPWQRDRSPIDTQP